MPDSIRTAELQAKTSLREVHVFARLGSTNARAAALLESRDLKLPAVIVASHQTAGKGQHDRQWFADAGSLAVTFVLPRRAHAPLQIPLRAGLAVRHVLAGLVEPYHRVLVKWPNDVLIEGRKVAGLLCQQIHHAALIGIGINVRTRFDAAPPPVRASAIALRDLITSPPPRTNLIISLWQALDEALVDPLWREQFNRHHLFNDHPITIDVNSTSLTGVCRGVDDDGRLLVETDMGQKALVTGRIRLD